VWGSTQRILDALKEVRQDMASMKTENQQTKEYLKDELDKAEHDILQNQRVLLKRQEDLDRRLKNVEAAVYRFSPPFTGNVVLQDAISIYTHQAIAAINELRWQYLALMRGYNSRHAEHTKVIGAARSGIDAVEASSQDMYDFLFPHGYRDQETGPIQKIVEEDDNSGAVGVKV